MSFWLATITLATAIAAAVCWPLLRPAGRARDRQDVLDVYRDQRRDLERDVERGLLDAAEAAAVRAEIDRRALATGRELERDGEVAGKSVSPAARPLIATILAIMVIGASVVVYQEQGRPDLPGQPLAARDLQAVVEQAEAQGEQLQQLEAIAIEQSPADPAFWLALGQMRGQLIGPEEAARAYAQGLERTPAEPRLLAARAEAMVQLAEGTVGQTARTLFEQALAADPANVLAAYYLGIADAQAGDDEAAVERWTALLAASPADAAWRGAVEQAVRMAAERLDLDPEAVIAEIPQAAPGPAAEIASLPADERNERIRGMVEGLAARLEDEPDDLEGWVQLGRSRSVLGEPEKAAAAFARARALAPEDPAIVKAEAAALSFAASGADGVPVVTDRAAELYTEAAALDPTDPEVHWFLGLRARQQGDTAAAAEHWSDLLALLPEDDPNRAAIAAEVEALRAAN